MTEQTSPTEDREEFAVGWRVTRAVRLEDLHCDHCGKQADRIHFVPWVTRCEAVVFSCREHCAVPDGYAFEASRWFSEDDWVEHIRAKRDGPDRNWVADGGHALALLGVRFAQIQEDLARAEQAHDLTGDEFVSGSWMTLRGFLEERADYLRVDVRPAVEDDGWDVCLRLDGTYAIEELATANANSIREQLQGTLLAEIPGIEERMMRWHGMPDEEDGTWVVPTINDDTNEGVAA